MKTRNGKIIAVWGSPFSGKTAFSTKLATAIYDNYQATVVVLYCDLETPVLPVIFPNTKAKDLGSVGVPLSKTEVEMDDILQNSITLKQRGNLVFLGYRTGENKYTYPKFGRAKAEALIELICEHADYLIIDCTSTLDNNMLSAIGIELADQIIRLASPDLKSISFYLSQLSVCADSKYRLSEHIQGLNTPNEDVFMPIEEAKAHLNDVRFTIPYCSELKIQAQSGTLYEPTSDKQFEKRMKEIAQKVVAYGTD